MDIVILCIFFIFLCYVIWNFNDMLWDVKGYVLRFVFYVMINWIKGFYDMWYGMLSNDI